MRRFPRKNFILSGFLALALAAAPLAAQRGGPQSGGDWDGGGGGMRGGQGQAGRPSARNREKARKQFEDICETLILDEDQSGKARALFDSSQKEIESAYDKFSRGKIGPGELKETTTRVNDKFLDDFGKLLNEEQAERFEMIRKDMQESREHRH
ncbi:hypothetical protein LLH00_19555 [bacterium]|nr:hypothetical protein [bacterium]